MTGAGDSPTEGRSFRAHRVAGGHSARQRDPAFGRRVDTPSASPFERLPMFPSAHLLTLRIRRGLAPAVGAVALAFIVGPSAAASQFGGNGGGPRVPNAFTVGARGGYDFKSDAPLIGLFARTSVVSRVSLQATGDLTFLDGLTERQAGADVLVRLGSQGFHVGGGPVWRNSIFPNAEGVTEVGAPRETIVGYSIVAILGGIPGRGRFLNAVEFRYTVVDELKPQLLSLQFGLPLARW